VRRGGSSVVDPLHARGLSAAMHVVHSCSGHIAITSTITAGENRRAQTDRVPNESREINFPGLNILHPY